LLSLVQILDVIEASCNLGFKSNTFEVRASSYRVPFFIEIFRVAGESWAASKQAQALLTKYKHYVWKGTPTLQNVMQDQSSEWPLHLRP